jgi:hypothetical protein
MAYCKQRSLAYCRFLYWRKKLTDSKPVSDGAALSEFARVASISKLEATEGLTVSLPGGGRVHPMT